MFDARFDEVIEMHKFQRIAANYVIKSLSHLLTGKNKTKQKETSSMAEGNSMCYY